MQCLSVINKYLLIFSASFMLAKFPKRFHWLVEK
jgi:hypothetical protein